MQTDPCLLSNRIHSLKHLRSTTSLGCKDIEIRKSEFVAKTQFCCIWSRSENPRCIILIQMTSLISFCLQHIMQNLKVHRRKNSYFYKLTYLSVILSHI